MLSPTVCQGPDSQNSCIFRELELPEDRGETLTYPSFPIAEEAMCAHTEMLAIFEPSSKTDLTRIFKLDF